jgi:hypothetical protein
MSSGPGPETTGGLEMAFFSTSSMAIDEKAYDLFLRDCSKVS